MSRTESSAFVELVLKEITDCLEKGETVKLSSFGSFMVRKKGQRIGRNPKTGTEVPISPRRVMVFKPSAILKQRINGHSARNGERQDRVDDSFNQASERSGHLDKAPDAFRTISEVADDLDIPQHVLRFWETRFTQIKPMKRSGGRRYYRPDDVDLLQGHPPAVVRRGLHHPRRAADPEGARRRLGAAAGGRNAPWPRSARSRRRSERASTSPMRPRPSTVESDDDDFDGEEQGIDYRFVEPDEEGILASFGKRRTAPRAQAAAASTRGLSAADRERLERVLLDLVACRQSLDAALKDG